MIKHAIIIKLIKWLKRSLTRPRNCMCDCTDLEWNKHLLLKSEWRCNEHCGLYPLPQDEWMSKTVAAGNTSDASNKNNCPCSNNQHVNCSSLQDGGGNKRLGMTLFTSADCFKKRRESRALLSAVSEKRREREKESARREREREERRGKEG